MFFHIYIFSHNLIYTKLILKILHFKHIINIYNYTIDNNSNLIKKGIFYMYKQIILSNPKYGVTGKFNIEKKIL